MIETVKELNKTKQGWVKIVLFIFVFTAASMYFIERGIEYSIKHDNSELKIPRYNSDFHSITKIKTPEGIEGCIKCWDGNSQTFCELSLGKRNYFLLRNIYNSSSGYSVVRMEDDLIPN